MRAAWDGGLRGLVGGVGHVLYVNEHRWLGGVCIAQADLFSMGLETSCLVRACAAFRQRPFPSVTVGE